MDTSQRNKQKRSQEWTGEDPPLDSWPDRDQESESESEPEKYDAYEFGEMGLKENLLRGIYGYGFEKPSVIQSTAIMPITQGLDIVAQAQSGTGKTGTFSIATLQLLDETLKKCQAIIVAPTRELAFQIETVMKSIGNYMDIYTVICVGGLNINDAKKKLDKGAQIVVGTPGRIIDMITRKQLCVGSVKLLILDEADELLSRSFQRQIKNIIYSIPNNAQICLFSATMPPESFELTKKFMKDPKSILVKRDELTLDGINQFYVNVEKDSWKFETLCDLYEAISISQSIIYVNLKKRATMLCDKLIERNFSASVIHSDMTSVERFDVMKKFRTGVNRVLISTDLLSRGIDVQQVSVVLNYDMPNDRECYIHRIGRSGRFGRKGVAINFVTDRDYQKVKELETFYQTQIQDLPINISDYM